MSDNKIILFGKYQGLTYKQVLIKDINYCKFIHQCPSNDKTAEFKEYLVLNLEKQLTENAKKKIDKVILEQSLVNPLKTQ